jgi:hypothetical protein
MAQGVMATRFAPRRHGLALAAITVIVVMLHALLTYEVSQQMREITAGEPAIQRMEAAYVSEVKLSKPPVAPAVAPAPPTPATPAPPPRRQRVAKVAKAASKPDEPASAPQPEAPASAVAEAASEPPLAAASAAEPAASQVEPPVPAVAKAASGAIGPTFVWPKATRVSYKLEGNYRGPIYGQASVEWVRQDLRYQVRVDASVGPSFAPLGSWSLISEGQIKPEGLLPSRYQNTNRLLIKTTPPKTIEFEDQEVVLPNGTRVPRLPGMQDPASQFVQLAYRFIMNPGLLRVGNTIEMPMVWLKKSEVLAYDVINEEVLQTPLGEVPTFHVKPRRAVAESGNTMVIEIWFAPQLQYLPIRAMIRLDDKTYMDMQMDQPPQQTPGDPPAGPVGQ